MLCTDCALWAANRDDSGASPDWDGRESAAGYIVTCDGESEHETFSTTPCDACGTRAAGERCPAEPLPSFLSDAA